MFLKLAKSQLAEIILTSSAKIGTDQKDGQNIIYFVGGRALWITTIRIAETEKLSFILSAKDEAESKPFMHTSRFGFIL